MSKNTLPQGRMKTRRRFVLLKLSHHALGILPGKRAIFKKRKRHQREPITTASEETRCGTSKPFEELTSSLRQDGCTRTKSEIPSLQLFHSQASTASQNGLVSVKNKQKSYLGKLQSRLSGAQFRMLNEKLYTCSGDEAYRTFQQDPAAFACYHAGYKEQMSQWPIQPLDSVIKWLQRRSTSLVVADFGCGEGKLAKSVKNKVISLDLFAFDESIIACNMAHTPLKTQSVDVAVFCLSLMGTDYPSFLIESYRVLKPRGSLLIAEVRSRFDPNNGGADPLDFINALKALGFLLISQVSYIVIDSSLLVSPVLSAEAHDQHSLVLQDFSKFFVMFEFVKQGNNGSKQCKWPSLKPCIYKRR